MTNHPLHTSKRLKLKNILHIKSDNKQANEMNKAKKNRPMSATRFTIFKNDRVTVYKNSNENKQKCILVRDIVEIYEIKTMNDIHENKVSIGKYITLGKNDRVLKPFFSKVKMEKIDDCNVKLYWFNSENEIWILNFENEDTCKEFCDNVLVAFEKKSTDIAELDIFLSDDEEEDDNEPSRHSSESDTLTHKSQPSSVDVLKMFKDALSKMNEFNFDTQIEKHEKRSVSTSSQFYKRMSLIDIRPDSTFDNSADYESTTRVNSENNNRYKRYSTFEFANMPRVSSGDNRNISDRSTRTVRRTALQPDI